MMIVLLFILAFVLLDFLALRFGTHSSPTHYDHEDRPNW